jgi:hypothetical protein
MLDTDTDIQTLLDEIDEMLAMTAGHQIVSASEITDKLLDLRGVVGKLSSTKENHHADIRTVQ